MRHHPLFTAAALTLAVAACTQTPPEGTAPAPSVRDRAPGGGKIDPADQTCSSSADCEITMTECSCDCGSPVNAGRAKKYAEARDRKCKGYQGRMCKMRCDAVPACDQGVCQMITR